MIRYSYLPEQFSDHDAIWTKIREVVGRGDFTLGRELQAFEEEFADRIGVEHAIGVNSGTDALFLSLKALGIRGEVITPPYSFFATTATIVNAGARPVFADVGNDFNIDPAAIEAAINPNTEAIMPVHWAGRPCNMAAINAIASRHGLVVIEDAAHAFGAKWAGKLCGSWGKIGCFSMHPLKTLNVWGDGGVITTDDPLMNDKLRRLRNHGLLDRNTCLEWGYNSRLDTVQAVVAHHVLGRIDDIIRRRRQIAALLDSQLSGCEDIIAVPMDRRAYSTYYLYTFCATERDRLLAGLIGRGVEAKAHYPVPIHLQPAAVPLGYRAGQFPVAERLAETTISLPAHEFITDAQINEMAAMVRGFYRSAKARDVA